MTSSNAMRRANQSIYPYADKRRSRKEEGGVTIRCLFVKDRLNSTTSQPRWTPRDFSYRGF
ncbi:MAG: hypothetical protein P8M80_15800 [Pirellulaceae bacterium]|nr:hypothetical protein [Pirellulaceae bacterium]